MASYKDAGVDVEAGYEAVNLMKGHVRRTFRPEVLTDIGGFGGLFALDGKKYKEPVLVSGTDGVGTKLKIAFLLDKHDTIGIDCVAMCVNDIVCSGAEPLFFLDYIASGKTYPEKVADIVKGISEGCVQAGCALLGGETAEMPGFYSDGEYDIAGFAVGVVEKEKIINGRNIVAGDLLIGIRSSGLHSNAFSLVRKLINPTKEKLSQFVQTMGMTLGEELLKPTRIYVRTILEATGLFQIKGISHITGGGFIENIPRMFPAGLRPVIKKGTWPILPIFTILQELGKIEEKEMFNTFNMGIGMVLAISEKEAGNLVGWLNRNNEEAFIIGYVIEGSEGIDIC
ncbi:MAG: phosphoribosylformylglycinamidine cyclo-ligase [Clostridiales bacterium]|nr:phosphoribosylformylglycinamidine cyclo-ligase [Clostridiales bacterium]